MSNLYGFKELYVELKGKTDGPADTYLEKVDGLNSDALHMIEKAAYDLLAAENKKLKDAYEHFSTVDKRAIGDILMENAMLKTSKQVADDMIEISNKEIEQLRRENEKLKETDRIWSKLSLVQITQDNERLRQANAELVEALGHAVDTINYWQEFNDVSKMDTYLNFIRQTLAKHGGVK